MLHFNSMQHSSLPISVKSRLLNKLPPSKMLNKILVSIYYNMRCIEKKCDARNLLPSPVHTPWHGSFSCSMGYAPLTEKIRLFQTFPQHKIPPCLYHYQLFTTVILSNVRKNWSQKSVAISSTHTKTCFIFMQHGVCAFDRKDSSLPSLSST